MIDTFRTFEELSKNMVDGVDYRVVTRDTNSRYLIVAIHGGTIEPFTSVIASAIAGENHSLYLLEGIDDKKGTMLHIGSRYFDDPRLMDMIRNAEIVVSIHGHLDQDEEFVMVGGLSEELVKKIIDHIQAVDIAVRPFERNAYQESPENICNKGMSGGGVEIKISKKLRDALEEDEGMKRLFINAIRHAIEAYR